MNFDLTEHLDNLHNNGFTIIKNGIESDLVDKVVKDFDEWSNKPEVGFRKHKLDRVTNFHIYNENTLNLATNEYVNEILNAFFEKPQVVYSSLFFREGTSQHFHRDTPHFFTNPIDKYCGVWYSLEDIDINAGPLKYIIGSHKIEDPSGYDIFNQFCGDNPMKGFEDFTYIFEYNKKIEELCKENNLLCVDETNYIYQIKKGDIIIWHPRLLHGGSNILDSTLTRYSMVTHNIPQDTAVFNATHFFCKEPTQQYLENKCLFKYIEHNNIKIVDHGIGPRVQTNYI
jgi:hypothetical protein